MSCNVFARLWDCVWADHAIMPFKTTHLPLLDEWKQWSTLKILWNALNKVWDYKFKTRFWINFIFIIKLKWIATDKFQYNSFMCQQHKCHKNDYYLYEGNFNDTSNGWLL